MIANVRILGTVQKTKKHATNKSKRRSLYKAILFPFAMLATVLLMFTDAYPDFEDD